MPEIPKCVPVVNTNRQIKVNSFLAEITQHAQFPYISAILSSQYVNIVKYEGSKYYILFYLFITIIL